QFLMMLRKVLVERVVLRHEDGERLGLATPRPARLLPHRRSGAGVARKHGGVERADVDPELERVRGGHGEQLAVRELPLDRPAVPHDASLSALRRAPVSSSITGGFQRAKSFRPRGDASCSMTLTSRPVRRAASSAGFPTVAVARHHRGSPPCAAISRRSLRRTIATWEPKTPRSTCVSSITTSDSRKKKSAHRA